MQEIDEKEFKNMLNSETITPYNVYNLDIDYPQLYSVEHYINNPSDNIEQEQTLNKLFLDIEAYTGNSTGGFDITKAQFPINAVTIYSTTEKIYRSYILLYSQNISLFPVDELDDLSNQFYDTLHTNGYIKEDDKIQIQYFTYEIDLLKQVWSDIHAIDPAVLSGWYSDQFDLPYMYFRLFNLLNKNEQEVQKIMSKFNHVKVQKLGSNIIIKIPDYPILDLLYLYKPRDEGGLNLGKKQASYSLDWISDFYLQRKKLDYKEEGVTLDSFYLNDPVNFLLYNIMDVTLCDGLNDRLRHIDHHNMYRRLMKTSLDASVRGAAVLFDTFVLYQLRKNNQFIRFGINDEIDFDIPSYEINKITKPTGKKKINWNIKEIDSNTVRKTISSYPGAYVKDSPGSVFTADDGLIIGLDAKSLYPSMILQHNISFDSFFGQIIDPYIYNTLDFLKTNIGNTQIIDRVCGSLLEFSINYVEKTEPANKNNAYQYTYYIAAYVMSKLINECKNFDSLSHPKEYKDYIMLKIYMLSLIRIMETIHSNIDECNSFAYDRFVNYGKKYKNQNIYILENYYATDLRINQINEKDFDDYLKEKNLSLTMSGGLFFNHEQKRGLFSNWLESMAGLRDEYKNTRDKYQTERGYSSTEAQYYDMLQGAVKVAMNTSYGLYGLTSFRYSNSYLASAITTQGRYMLKICQQISDMYIDYYSKNK